MPPGANVATSGSLRIHRRDPPPLNPHTQCAGEPPFPVYIQYCRFLDHVQKFTYSCNCETGSGKSRSAHKSSSSRTQTSILVAANTQAGGWQAWGSGRGRKPPLRACVRDAGGPHSGLARAFARDPKAEQGTHAPPAHPPNSSGGFCDFLAAHPITTPWSIAPVPSRLPCPPRPPRPLRSRFELFAAICEA